MQEDLAWIDAFRRHHIYPSQVEDLSEDSLLWRNPQTHQPNHVRLRAMCRTVMFACSQHAARLIGGRSCKRRQEDDYHKDVLISLCGLSKTARFARVLLLCWEHDAQFGYKSGDRTFKMYHCTSRHLLH